MKNQAVILTLKAIAEENKGLLRPRDVVSAARSKRSPLHKFFTWADGKAAEKWRLHEARQLLAVTVEYIGPENNGRESRVFVNLKSDRPARMGYRPLIDVLSNAQWREQLLKDALDTLATFRAKFGELKELASIFQAIELAEQKISRRTRKKAA